MSGNEDANQQLIQCWYGRVYAQCQSTLRSPTDAEDATQETFVRGLAQLDRLKTPAALGGWLRGIAHNVCVDLIRRSHVRPCTTDSVDSIPTRENDSDSTRKDEQAFLIGLVHELPQQFRETILLHYYEDMTYDEIANWLGVARSTVNERLSKARSLLKQKLLTQRCRDEV
jgi:RNA polymerase sigma-70 factor (ECF subfamily)